MIIESMALSLVLDGVSMDAGADPLRIEAGLPPASYALYI